MGFEEGLRDNAALLGTIGAAASLRNQRIQNEALAKQNKLLEEQAETERRKLDTDQQRLEIEKERFRSEKEHREKKEVLEQFRKKAIKEVRHALANAKTAIDRMENEVQLF